MIVRQFTAPLATILALGLTLTASTRAQTPATPSPQAPSTTAAAPAAPSAPASLAISAPSAAAEPKFLTSSKINVSGILDGYYNYDANNPTDGNTQLRNFDIRADTVSLTEARLTLAHDPAPFGIRVDAGLGSAFEVMHPSHPAGGGLKYIEQMFVSAKPAKWKGFQADFGQFVTSAGAEVMESADNWNYSRSLLFSLATPYYHFGLRTSMPINASTTVGVQVVQGWNNIFDNNSGKTVGLTASHSSKYYTATGNYYVGPENDHTTHGYRNLFDAVLLLTPSAKVNMYLNYDYGQNRNPNAALTGTGSLAHWQGIAWDEHMQITSKLAASLRGEYFNDNNGFQTGLAQQITEFTVTGEYHPIPGILSRIEFRRDNSSAPFFTRGSTPFSSSTQSTLEISTIAYFGPKT